MKSPFFVMLLLFFVLSSSTEGQIFKKIKKALEKKTEKTIFSDKDDTSSDTAGHSAEGNHGGSGTVSYEVENKAKAIHTDAKRAFYRTDVLVKTFDKEKQAYTTSCFDAGEIAMKSEWKDSETGEAQEMFIDSEGYFISFNKKTGLFEKSNMLSGAMSMMAPSIMASAYKLPTGVVWETAGELEEKGLNFNTFLYVDFVFMLRPEHFRNADYTETKTACRGATNCLKFKINEAEYKNSYILFDAQQRLAEINVVLENHSTFGSGAGKLEFFYQPCKVLLPKANEIKSPMQDIIKFGLDPTKN